MNEGKQFIKDLAHGSRVSSIFSVKYKHPPRGYRNGFMFTVGLADMSGEIEATYWGGSNPNTVHEVYDSFKEDDVISVSGIVGTFKERLKIDVDPDSGGMAPAEEYDADWFVARSTRDVDELLLTILKTAESMENIHLQELLRSFFKDADFVEKIKKAPAAMYIHHACIGGLLEHTLNVLNICEGVWDIYPSMDRDLLLSGAILHDIGKIQEFKVTTNIKISEEGMLLGHISVGLEMLQHRIRELEGFPEELAMKLSHIILSHHGKGEYGSPREPQFPEAAVVHYADEMDAKIFQYIRIKEDADTEDFHVYSKRLGQIYLK